MNPSTEDVLNAIEKINADHIFILPNNKNIILAAQQAAALIQDKEILVVQTRNVPQGITAMLNFASDFSAEENLKMMEEAIQEVHTGMTTFAIRDTHLGDFEIHKDDILGMLDGELSVVDRDVDVVSKELIDRLVEMDKELFTVVLRRRCDRRIPHRPSRTISCRRCRMEKLKCMMADSRCIIISFSAE